jgi:hypothetical protein
MEPTHRQAGAAPQPEDADLERVMREVVRSLRSLRYGSVEIVVHDSRVVQIERKEKLRFDRG